VWGWPRKVWAVLVPPALVGAALAALDASDREASEGPAREPQAPDHGRSYVGLAAAATIAAFFWVSGPRDGPDVGGWFRVGSGVAADIVHGQWWRVVTALTLHSDFMHVTAMRWLSSCSFPRWGAGWVEAWRFFATLLAGAAGNLLNRACLTETPTTWSPHPPPTFAALGLLAVCSSCGASRAPTVGRLKRAFLRYRRQPRPVSPCWGLESVRHAGHAAGLGFGLGFGLLWGHLGASPGETAGAGHLFARHRGRRGGRVAAGVQALGTAASSPARGMSAGP